MSEKHGRKVGMSEINASDITLRLISIFERVERRENLSGNGENKKKYEEVIIRNF